MRVAFMGTPGFAVPTLRRLLESEHEVVAVVAQPSRPAGRGRQLVDPPTVEMARQKRIPVFQPRAVRSGPFPEWWVGLDADVGVVVAYGRILTPQLLQGPRHGCINVHASLLPRYRGAAPIQWSVARGETLTGITTMKMDEGLDTGDVLLQATTPIGPDETAAELAGRLAEIGGALLVDTLARLDTLTPIPQDHARHTLAPPLAKDDGRVDWTLSAAAIHCLVRGMTPWPGAWTLFRGQPIRIHRVNPVETRPDGVAPGQIFEVRPQVRVAAGQGAVEIIEVQLPCRNRQCGAAFINGCRVEPGEDFPCP